MSYHPERRSLKLTPEQWISLETLAERLQATAPTGTGAGKSSWRTLIKLIADGDVLIYRAGEALRE